MRIVNLQAENVKRLRAVEITPNGVPYRAGGTPAEVCSGWSARHRAIAASRAEAAA